VHTPDWSQVPLPHWWDEQIPLERAITDIPTMLAIQELRFLHGYLRDHFQGRGAVVDLGTFLGAGAAAMASGLRANPRLVAHDHIVHSYDSFEWNNLVNWWKGPLVVGGAPAQLNPQENFAFAAQQNVAPWRDLIQIHEGWVDAQTWSGDPIEFLMVDIMKSRQTTRDVLLGFFTCLQPEISMVYHQDYKFLNTAFIHLSMYRLRHHFLPVYSLPVNALVFRCIRPVSREDALQASDFDDFTIQEMHDAFSYSAYLMQQDYAAIQHYIDVAHLDAFLDCIVYLPLEYRQRAAAEPLFWARLERIFGIDVAGLIKPGVAG
jgi:hypothetical protein